MKRIYSLLAMTFILAGAVCCTSQQKTEETSGWVVDCFDDIRVLRYEVPGYDTQSLKEKQLIYYLSEAALCGREILFDQNGPYNLRIKRALEAIYAGYPGDRKDPKFLLFEKYLKKVWFANGIHHHYSMDKFIPEFPEEYFDHLVSQTPRNYFPTDFGSVEGVISLIKPVIFDPEVMPKRVNLAAGADLITTSANNYYEGVTQKEVEAYYTQRIDSSDRSPVSYGLNSKLIKEFDGTINERVWKEEGMYSNAITWIVYWLKKAATVAQEPQRETIEQLINYYRTGDLKFFDAYSIQWLQDTVSKVDFINGFIESYGDPLGYRGSWESLVNFRDEEATRRTRIISDAAQWFEDHSPIDPRYRKPQVKGVSAKVITAAILSGDCYPATPIGINLPNSDWIRHEFGSKSVTIGNITAAYAEASKGSGFDEEFIADPELIAWNRQYGILGDDLHTDLHECLGHGSGRLAPGVKGDELKNYGSTLEEARADLFALYYLGDPKMVELGLIPTLDVAKVLYARYMLNGMMTQLARIEPGKTIEESHMRNRKLIAEWCYEKGLADRVVEKVERGGKTYIVVNDYDKLRKLFGDLLREIQRIKSTGDFQAGKALVERYGVQVDPQLHEQVLERYAKLGLAPYNGFVNPYYEPVIEDGVIVDVKLRYTTDYVGQMMNYAKNYSHLPSVN